MSKNCNRSCRKSSYNLKPRKIKEISRKEEEMILTIHHRRPRSLGGVNKNWNISYIPMDVHRAWTIITGNMNAEQICNHINQIFKPKGLTVICVFINGHRCVKTGSSGTKVPEKQFYAWNVIFKEQISFQNKINYINNVLIDPSYRLYVIN